MALVKLPIVILMVSKSNVFTIAVTVVLVALFSLLVASMASPVNINGKDDTEKSIKSILVGKNITYYSIAGQPMNYLVTEEDIGTIEQTTYNGTDALKVRVGNSLAWDFIINANGTEILEINQLFYT